MALKKQFSDIEFIEGLKNNNDLILTGLYKKHYPSILKFIITNNGSEQEAKDVYQDSILILYNNCKKEEFILTSSLQTYIYSIAKRLWFKQLNKNKIYYRLSEFNNERELDVDVSVEIDDYEEKENQYQKMNQSVNKLGEPCKSILEEYYVNKLNMEEIAEKFGYTNADNAKNQKYKCLQRLKRLYFNEN